MFGLARGRDSTFYFSDCESISRSRFAPALVQLPHLHRRRPCLRQESPTPFPHPGNNRWAMPKLLSTTGGCCLRTVPSKSVSVCHTAGVFRMGCLSSLRSGVWRTFKSPDSYTKLHLRTTRNTRGRKRRWVQMASQKETRLANQKID